MKTTFLLAGLKATKFFLIFLLLGLNFHFGYIFSRHESIFKYSGILGDFGNQVILLTIGIYISYRTAIWVLKIKTEPIYQAKQKFLNLFLFDLILELILLSLVVVPMILGINTKIDERNAFFQISRTISIICVLLSCQLIYNEQVSHLVNRLSAHDT